MGLGELLATRHKAELQPAPGEGRQGGTPPRLPAGGGPSVTQLHSVRAGRGHGRASGQPNPYEGESVSRASRPRCLGLPFNNNSGFN